MKFRIILLSLILLCIRLFAQDTVKNKGTFKDVKKGYYQNVILKGIDKYEDSIVPAKKKNLGVDLDGINLPSSPDEFTKYWCNSPISQGNAGTCWSFATTSFFESEIFRITGKKVKLSEMYFVYLEYVERAKYFVKQKGDCTLGEGSEANALPRLMKLYGVMPEAAYNGLLKGQTVYDNSKLCKEYETYLAKVKESNAWNDSVVVGNIKAILNRYLGTSC